MEALTNCFKVDCILILDGVMGGSKLHTHTPHTSPCVGPVGILADDSMCPFNVLIQIPRPENIVAQRLFSSGKKKKKPHISAQLVVNNSFLFLRAFQPESRKTGTRLQVNSFLYQKKLGAYTLPDVIISPWYFFFVHVKDKVCILT